MYTGSAHHNIIIIPHFPEYQFFKSLFLIFQSLNSSSMATFKKSQQVHNPGIQEMSRSLVTSLKFQYFECNQPICAEEDLPPGRILSSKIHFKMMPNRHFFCSFIGSPKHAP